MTATGVLTFTSSTMIDCSGSTGCGVSITTSKDIIIDCSNSLNCAASLNTISNIFDGTYFTYNVFIATSSINA